MALAEAEKHCPKFVVFIDLAQDAVPYLLSKPPKFDPSKGTTPESFLYTVVQRFMLKYNVRQFPDTAWFKQMPDRPESDDEHDVRPSETPAGTKAARLQAICQLSAEPADKNHKVALKEFAVAQEGQRSTTDLTMQGLTTDDVLAFLSDERSRELCRVIIKCAGNVSEAARRLGIPKSTIRSRWRLLAPKLVASGFDPVRNRAWK